MRQLFQIMQTNEESMPAMRKLRELFAQNLNITDKRPAILPDPSSSSSNRDPFTTCIRPSATVGPFSSDDLGGKPDTVDSEFPERPLHILDNAIIQAKLEFNQTDLAALVRLSVFPSRRN